MGADAAVRPVEALKPLLRRLFESSLGDSNGGIHGVLAKFIISC